MFHHIWLSDPLNPTPIPPKYEANWSAWRRQFPGEEFRTCPAGTAPHPPEYDRSRPVPHGVGMEDYVSYFGGKVKDYFL